MFEFTSSGVSGYSRCVDYVDLSEVAGPSEAELAEIEAMSAVCDAEVAAVGAESALMAAVDELASRRFAVHVARHEVDYDGVCEAA